MTDLPADARRAQAEQLAKFEPPTDEQLAELRPIFTRARKRARQGKAS